jgi:imidazolonepropionase
VTVTEDSSANRVADLVIEGGQVLTMDDGAGQNNGRSATAAGQTRGLGLVTNGRVLIGGGKILPPDCEVPKSVARIEVRNKVVAPGLIDAHAHPCFAGSRADEFAMRAAGASYAEIAAAGGGIWSTVQATRSATEAELRTSLRTRLLTMRRHGTTTTEAKSGYALSTAGELRMLKVLANTDLPIEIVPTLLAAHAVPPDTEREAYIQAVIDEMIPQAAQDGLARFCDVFCEQGAFTLDESRRILQAAKSAGLGLRLHAGQFSDLGAAELAAELGAISADHLEHVSDRGIEAMAQAGVIATLLPGAALMLRLSWPRAREMIEAGVRIALGTDCNPGTSMTEALPLMTTLAVTQMRMTCEEVWRAITVQAAKSLGREDLGRLAPGCQADVVVFDFDDWRALPYHYGTPRALCVVKRGLVGAR